MMGPNGTNLHVAGNAADDSNSLLAWNHHQAVLIQSMKSMRHSCDFSDVTLCAEGELFKAHRFVLSSCSEYMKTLLTHTVDYSNPFVIIDASKDHVKMMLDYMYYGEVTIRDKDINGFLEAAQKLRIMGLLLSYANATEEVPPVDSQETPNTSIQKTMELAHVHADYMLDKYRNNASTPTHHQLIRPKPSAFLTDELRSRSPPPKRQRVSALPLAAAAMHHMLPPLNLDTNNKNTTKSTKKEVEPAFLGLTNGPSTLPRNTTNNIKPSRYVPEMISNHDPHSTTFTTLPSTHTNATATTSTTVTTASDTTANVNADLNNSTASSEFNPLPLVKVELQTDEEESCLMMDCSANSPPSPCEPHATDTKVFDATATAPSNMSAFGIDGTGTVPVNQNPEVEQKLMEPLTEGAGPSGAGGSIQQLIAAAAAAAEADVPAGTSVQDYLQKELLDGPDDDCSDSDEPPALVVEENPDPQGQYQCKNCPVILANQNLLKRHVEDMHLQNRKHVCAMCSKRFKRKEHVERHMRIHTGCKPFTCYDCKLKFTQKEHLKGHIDSVHLKKKKPPGKKAAKRKPTIKATRGRKKNNLIQQNNSDVGADGTNIGQPGPSGVSNLMIKPEYLLTNGNKCNSSSRHIPVIPSGQRKPAIRVIPHSTMSNSAMSPSGPLILPRGPSNLSSASAGLLGRMVGNNQNTASIGTSMFNILNSCMNNANNMVRPSGCDGDSSGSTSRTTSPPTLTSPNSLGLSTQFLNNTAAFPGSILSSENLSSIITGPSSSNPSSTGYVAYPASSVNKLATTLPKASIMNSVFTANLPNTAFSNSVNCTSPTTTLLSSSGLLPALAPTRPTPKSRGRGGQTRRGGGRGRGGRGGGGGGGVSTAIAAAALLSFDRRSEVDGNITNAIPSVLSDNMLTIANTNINNNSSNSNNNNIAATKADGNGVECATQKISAIYAPVSASNATYPERHIQQMVLNME